MKITINSAAAAGVLLQYVDFGTVVRRVNGDTYYIVVSMMNGTGHRALVSLQSGTIKLVEQDLRVTLVDATLYVHGDLP